MSRPLSLSSSCRRLPRQLARDHQSTLSFLSATIRLVILDLPLVTLFAFWMAALLLNKVHDDYLLPQLQLMKFDSGNGRDVSDMTYYDRTCDGSDSTIDVSAKEHHKLIFVGRSSETKDGVTNQPSIATTTKDAVVHMLTHGVSVYPNLLSNETIHLLREFIVQQNDIQTRKDEDLQWDVLEREHRSTWPIDMNSHPTLLHTFWKELAIHNPQFLPALEAIVGHDPAVLEFSVIIASYGARDQKDHQDVSFEASATAYARTFFPTYSLLIPLQDTTAAMGATHVCPGTHVCGDGGHQRCSREGHGITMSEITDEGIWKQGWGVLLNQQVIHRGTAHTDADGVDRVAIVITWAPRPQYHHRGRLETRMTGHGGADTMIWNQYGHTFSDYLRAETRMSEPQKTLRSLGIINGNGWDWPAVVSMRMANERYKYTYNPQTFVMKLGGYWFLPHAWQRACLVRDRRDEFGPWYPFLRQLATITAKETKKLHLWGLGAFVVIQWLVNLIRFLLTTCWALYSSNKRQTTGGGWVSILKLSGIRRVFLLYGVVIATSFALLWNLERTQWARSIRYRKLFRVPDMRGGIGLASQSPPTVPMRSDILLSPHYSWDAMAAHSRMLDFGHPGNRFWKQVIGEHNAKFYGSARPNVQLQFCKHLANRIGTNRRFLKHNSDRSWTVLTDNEIFGFCHSELVGAAFPLVECLSNAMKHLLNEAEFGLWRGSSMQGKTNPTYLRYLQRKFLPALNLPEVHAQLGEMELVSPKILHATDCRRQPSIQVSILDLHLVSPYECVREHCHKLPLHHPPTEEPRIPLHGIPYSIPSTTS